MRPNAKSSAVKAAARAVRESSAGLTSLEVAAAIGAGLKHAQKCLTVLSHEGLVKACKDGSRHTIWLTPERADAHTAAIRAARPSKKRESERARALLKPRNPRQPTQRSAPLPVPPPADDGDWLPHRVVVPAAVAVPLRTTAARSVFEWRPA